jgi:hypothetical protein
MPLKPYIRLTPEQYDKSVSNLAAGVGCSFRYAEEIARALWPEEVEVIHDEPDTTAQA